jgi:hypothetical protein
MPNTPLQTFRAVEPANYGFGAAATLASRPFVLNHCTYTFTGAGSAVTTQAVTFNAATADANRFIPWLARNFDNPATTGSYYPVRVPQAYDRIYVFPMYRTSTDDTQVNANAVTLTQSSYDAPRVFPMGLFPETRDYTTSNPNNPLNAVIPEDVIRKGYPTHVSNADYNTRTHGIWSPPATSPRPTASWRSEAPTIRCRSVEPAWEPEPRTRCRTTSRSRRQDRVSSS